MEKYTVLRVKHISYKGIHLIFCINFICIMIYINIECCTPDSNIILYISCTSKKMSLSYVGMENSEE